MGWLDHRELRIVKGVYIVPGDTSSVEPAIVELNLLSNNTGIALTADGWTPNIPSLKNGGVWADSPVSDGRTLISGVNGNVTETMRLVITGGTYKEAAGYLAALNNMIRDCRDFWQSNAQINPVFLQWYASCGTGRQYALIYNMDFDAEYKDSPTPKIEGTLTIERECYWRAIPPGANPKQWSAEAAGNVWNTSRANLLGTSDNLFYDASLANKSEFGTGFLTLSTDNCIVIPAASIPGDAPALVALGINYGTSVNMIIGKKSIKLPVYSVASLIPQNNTFNGPDGTLGTNATLANDTGATKAAGSGTAQRVEVSFATATNASRWYNSTSIGTNTINRFIGRFMVFMRCRQSAGSVGDITMYMRHTNNGVTDADGVKLNVVSPPVIAGAGNTTAWGLVYMGVITSPLTQSKASESGGLSSANVSVGLANQTAQNLILNLFALRSAGVGLLYICDVILVPVDEGSLTIELADASGSLANLVDNTGYILRGGTDMVGMNGNNLLGGASLKLTGDGFTLDPNVENRLYTVLYDSSTQSTLSHSADFGVNIVPRCTGIRGF